MIEVERNECVTIKTHRLGNFTKGKLFELQDKDDLFISLYSKYDIVYCKHIKSGDIVSFSVEKYVYIINDAKIIYTSPKVIL